VWLAALAWAADPAPGWAPSVEASGVVEAYRAWASGRGRPAPAAELVCRPFAEATVLCFTRDDGKKRVYATAADRQTAATLEAAAAGEAPAALACLEDVAVEGSTRRYAACAAGTGAEHRPLLHPAALAARFGGSVVVGIPARGVLVAWAPGDLEFDTVVGVGVRRMYESLPDPVSPLLYTWNGLGWVTWGEVRLAPTATPSESVPAPPGP